MRGGFHEDCENHKELIFVLPKIAAICTGDEITRAEMAYNGDPIMHTPTGASSYFTLHIIKFKFPENGRMEVWFNEKNVSGSLYYLSLIFKNKELHSTDTSVFAAEALSTAKIPSLSAFSQHNYISMKEYEFQLLVEFCKKNGIDIDKTLINKISYVVLATHPALRELWHNGINLDNFMRGAEWEYGDRYSSEKTEIPTCLTKNSFKETVKECFGYDSKKLIKMIASRIYKIHHVRIDFDITEKIRNHYSSYQVSEKDPNLLQKQQINQSILLLGELVKDLITVDHMYKLIEENTIYLQKGSVGGYSLDCDSGRKLLEIFPVETRMKLLKDLVTFTFNAKDTYTQYNKYKDWTNFTEKAKRKGLVPIKIPSRWKNIKELHDNISRQFRDIEAAVNNKDIEYDPEILEILDNVQVGNLIIQIPKESAELAKWGKAMGNCVACSGSRAASGDCIILGIFKDGTITHNVELSVSIPLATIGEKQHEFKTKHYMVREFRGIKNKESNKEERQLIEDYLLSKELIKVLPTATPKFAAAPQAPAPQEDPFRHQNEELEAALRQVIRDAGEN